MTFIIEATPGIDDSLKSKLPYVADIVAIRYQPEEFYARPYGCQCSRVYQISRTQLPEIKELFKFPPEFDDESISYLCDCLGKFIKDDGDAN